MPKQLFFALSLFAVFAGVSFGQPSVGPGSAAARLGLNNSDPLGILETDEADEKKTAGVRSSVIIRLSSIERVAFDLVNQKRRESGLKPLTWNEDIAAVARSHSQNMAEFSFFSHRGLDSKLVSDRADAHKVGHWRAIGENIAFNRGYGNPTQKAVALWLDSSAHRHNMMDPAWRESAIGVAVASDGSYYFTQVFLVRR
jgi:uncharacterized protein YkwD